MKTSRLWKKNPRLSKALDEHTPCNKVNHLHANPSKTQVCAFYLHNRKAKRPLQVALQVQFWNTASTQFTLVSPVTALSLLKTHVEKTKSEMCSKIII